MIASLLALVLAVTRQGVPPSSDMPQLIARPIGHEALLMSDWTSAQMLQPEREQWAVAVVKGVGEYGLRDMSFGGGSGPWRTFDVDLDVVDGWNVPRGPIRAFWWEGGPSRRSVIGRMVGQHALVRFAPVRDGRHLLVGASVEPAFEARAGEPFVSILLPYPGTRLETGEPKLRAWKTLWRAGLALDASAYKEFDIYMDGSSMPLTPHKGLTTRREKNGFSYKAENPGLADAQWLFRLAQQGSPEYRLFIAEYLNRDGIEGSLQMKRDLVLLSLRQPDAFPNGLFRVASYYGLNRRTAKGYEAWLPIPKVVDAILATPHPMLASDLLELLIYEKFFVADRAKLLPLLTVQDSTVRDQVVRAFELWHGKPPTGTDPVAWHRSRAKMGMEELTAAKMAQPGG